MAWGKKHEKEERELMQIDLTECKNKVTTSSNLVVMSVYRHYQKGFECYSTLTHHIPVLCSVGDPLQGSIWLFQTYRGVLIGKGIHSLPKVGTSHPPHML